MNLGMFDLLVRWTELTGCSMDEALQLVAIIWFIGFVLFGWAVGFLFDFGYALYKATRELFRLIRDRIRRKEDDEL